MKKLIIIAVITAGLFTACKKNDVNNNNKKPAPEETILPLNVFSIHSLVQLVGKPIDTALKKLEQAKVQIRKDPDDPTVTIYEVDAPAELSALKKFEVKLYDGWVNKPLKSDTTIDRTKKDQWKAGISTIEISTLPTANLSGDDIVKGTDFFYNHFKKSLKREEKLIRYQNSYSNKRIPQTNITDLINGMKEPTVRANGTIQWWYLKQEQCRIDGSQYGSKKALEVLLNSVNELPKK